MAKFKTAIIGTGGVSTSHVNAVQSNEDRVELVAAVDIEEERVNAFCGLFNIPGCYTNPFEMLSVEKPDLVQICTPPGPHLELIEASLEAGAWVLCEKPLCASLAELDQIEAAEARTGRYCSSIFQWRFGAGGRHLKRLIDAGELGRPMVGNCLTTWYRNDEYYAAPWRGKWETELGGVTMNLGIHAIDFFLWLYGDWKEVRSMMGTLNHDIDVEDVSMAMVRFENGAMGNITNSTLSPREESYLRFDFEQATVEVTHLYRYLNENWRFSMIKGEENEEKLARWREIDGIDTTDFHGLQLSSFLDSMEVNQRPDVSGPDVRGTLEFLASMYKSAMTGLPVLRGSITEDDPFFHRMCGPCDQTWQKA
jgi:predicted dehydrogenase